MKTRMIEGESETTEINISPLIDMVFILLIFFIVTTVFVEENGLGIETPVPTPIVDSPDAEPFVIRISEGGAVFLGNREIGQQGVASAILNARNEGSLESVTVEVHEKTKVAAVAQVLDTCAALKVEKVVTKTSQEQTQ